MPQRTLFALALGLNLFAANGPIAAQSTTYDRLDHEGLGEEKLAYVQAAAPSRVFYCEATPQGTATSKTLISLEFTLDGSGPLIAQMTVTGSVEGRFYQAKIGWRGTAQVDGSRARLVLKEVSSFDADPLPGKARWSDPKGDIIRLNVEDYPRRSPRDGAPPSPQRFILRGTQETELGTNDLSCLDGPRR